MEKGYNIFLSNPISLPLKRFQLVHVLSVCIYVYLSLSPYKSSHVASIRNLVKKKKVTISMLKLDHHTYSSLSEVHNVLEMS